MARDSGSIIGCCFWAIALLLALSFQGKLFVVAEETIEVVENATIVSSNLTSNVTSNLTFSNETFAPTASQSPSSTPTTAEPTASQSPSSTPTIFDCEASHYDCYGCLRKGCYWCPTDGLCFEKPEYVERDENKQKLWPDRFHNCKTPESFTQTTCTTPYNFFEDPLYSAQNWIFQAVKIVPVWERGYFGKGIRVRINDDGIETTHPEFFGRLDINASCPNGTATSFPRDHGMTVASMLGAAGNNSDCGVGIAPEVTMSSCLLGTMDREEMLVYELDSFDISQNSWAFEGCGPLSPRQYNEIGGRKARNLQNNDCPFVFKPFEGYLVSPCDKCNFTNPDQLGSECIQTINTHCSWFPVEERRGCLEYLDLILLSRNPDSEGECHFGTLPEASIDAFTRGITEGRNGKGIIYVFAAGNEYVTGDDTNFQGYGANTRFTIPVAAVGKPGTISPFSTPGASVFIAAPGGDETKSVTPIVAASYDGTCTTKRDGTSFAAPVVSGVVALMLEANPELTWRDVQQILSRTAQVVNDGTDPSFAINGAGKTHSNRYGFGVVNADEAVKLSEKWVNIGKELSLVEEGSNATAIPDNRNNSTKFNLTFDSGDVDFETENVYLYVKVEHSSRGHLRIDLTSPSGMISVMSPGERPEAQQTGWMKFTSVRYWNEDPNGEWVISIIDTTLGDVNNCIDYDDYEFPYIEDDSDFVISCAPKHYGFMSQFCNFGFLDPNAYVATQCNEGDQDACARLERFNSTQYNGRTGPEACCVCGGGFSPDVLPETVVGWKVVIYGHEKTDVNDYFPGLVNATANANATATANEIESEMEEAIENTTEVELDITIADETITVINGDETDLGLISDPGIVTSSEGSDKSAVSSKVAMAISFLMGYVLAIFM